MNEKLNIQDLTDQLAENHGLSKKNAESFVKDFFTVIEEALEKDKYVKVKGLGTFKLIDVDSRESINVNTGERFEIQGHSKISFTPDSTLKEVVNKPFSAFETVVLSDEVDDDAFFPTNDVVEDEFFPQETEAVSEEADSEPINETPSDVVEDAPKSVEESPKIESVPEVAESELVAEENVQEESIVGEEPVAGAESLEEPEPMAEEKAIMEEEVLVEEEISEEKETPAESDVKILPIFDDEEIKKRDQPVSHQEEVKALRLSDEKRKEISRKAEGSSTPYLMFAAVLIIFLCLGAVAYLYYPDLASRKEPVPVSVYEQPKAEQQNTPKAEPAETSAEETASVSEQAEQKVPNMDNITVKEESVPAKTNEIPAATKQPEDPVAAPTENGIQKLQEGVPYKTDGDLATYTLQKGETLNMVARKFYGVGTLYTYIVSYNKNVIKNPDNVPAGTTIKIPKLVKK